MSYNGYPNFEFWNVALHIQNDESLYNLAIACIRRDPGSIRLATLGFLDDLAEFNITETAHDGVEYTYDRVYYCLNLMSEDL